MRILDEVCREYRVRRLAVFGSVAREQAHLDSDLDLLVEYEANYTPTYLDMAALADALRPILGNREIDLVLPDSLHWFIRDEVLGSAQTVYER
ncbi:MAG TPA: nucleotidyltransferase domain-containing protein [Tepidisphaeraceae bacterium]|nr:nucleotidyltransferase domain-containing protein [Tepidisphaeraceae bacterium]